MISNPSLNHEHTDNQTVKMEVNIDNIPGQWLGYVMDVLFEADANDVFYTAIYMKKTARNLASITLFSKGNRKNGRNIIQRNNYLRGSLLSTNRVSYGENLYKSTDRVGAVTVKQGIFNGEFFSKVTLIWRL